MNTRKTADAVVRRLEDAIPVYNVSERGYSFYVSLVDGRDFIVDAPLGGDVGIAPGVRTYEDGLQPLEDPDAGFELRVRDDAGGWAR